MTFQISEIGQAKDIVDSLIGEKADRYVLPEDAEMDTAGAQLLAAACLAARAEGRDLALCMTPGSKADELWKRLALDSICAPLAPDRGAET